MPADVIDRVRFGRVAGVLLIARAAQAGIDSFIGGDPSACGTIQTALDGAIDSNVIPYDAALTSYRRTVALRTGLSS